MIPKRSPAAIAPDTKGRDLEAVRRSFTAALDSLVEEIKGDRAILAAILCGSLAHDAVWARSDIDLVLITIDDRKAESQGMVLFADERNVHAMFLTRTGFRQLVEGSIRQSFMHSFLTKGRLLYAHDPSIVDLFGQLGDIGDRDTQLQLFESACGTLPSLYKAHKFWITRGDPDYTALWILHAAQGVARMEVLSARMVADREVLPQASALNPVLFAVIYHDLLDARKTPGRVQAALDTVDRYLEERAPTVFAPIVDFLREAGDPRSASEIESHFVRHHGLNGTVIACEYLADQRLIGKASLPARLTKRSTVNVQEVAFYALSEGEAADATRRSGR